MIKAIVVALLAISATRQACDVGCLKCNSSGDCLIPDILNSFYLNGTTATKVSLTNCTVNSFDGKCVACGSGYYLDAATNKCVAVATTGLITNCASYSSATSCSSCNSSYYLSNNACVAVETKVSNCDVYVGASACATCSSGYLLSLDNKSCVTTPSISNCGDFTFVKCNSCDSGYVLNPNNYLSLNLVSTSTADKTLLTSFAYNALDGRSQSIAQNACQVQSTTNCGLFDQGTNTCTQCSSGYYLDATNATCIVFPDEPIENCLTYTSVNVCSECVANYYFKSGSCTQITGTDIITNCSTYNGKASSIQCVACNNNNYLSNNSCVARNVSADNKIANCATKENASDKCAACATGYVLAIDGGQCYPVINNCATYVSTSSASVLKCNTCNSGFYLTNTDSSGTNSCQAGSVENCSVYSTGSGTTCVTCANKYYLSGSTCAAHVNIDKCNTYNTTNANYCLTCTNPGYFNFTLIKYCQTVTNLQTNCATYGGDISAPVCAACNSGFYLVDGGCTIAVRDSCFALTAGKCSNCLSGYYLNKTDDKCYAPPSFITENCLVNNTSQAPATTVEIDGTSCSVCETGAVPFNLKGYYTCIKTSEATSFKSAPTVDGCSKYNNNMECIQCGKDSTKPYLKLDADPTKHTCVASCTGGIVRYTIADFSDAANGTGYNIEKMNVCFDSSLVTAVSNCSIYAPDISEGDIDVYICIKCDATYMNVVAVDQTSYSNVDPSATDLSSYFPSAFAKFPKVTCVLPSAGNSAPNSALISNCSYYIVSDTKHTCLRCDIGYSGTIVTGGISACTLDSSCASDRYYNLDLGINTLASCHKCNAASTIPFIAYKTSDINSSIFTGFGPYVVAKGAALTYSTGTANSEKNIQCRDYSANVFNIATPVTVPNCGIAIININSNGNYVKSSDYGNFCAACKPGYKGTRDATENTSNLYAYSGCEIITNCSTNSSYFNACSSCATGNILKYHVANKIIDFKTCLSFSATDSPKFDNCMAAAALTDAGSSANKCMICKNGYFLNGDNICDKYTPKFCDNSTFTPIQRASDNNSLDWALWLNSNAVGCSSCGTGSIAYQFNTYKATCVKSDWVSKSVDTAAKVSYIPNCKNYSVNNTSPNASRCNTCNTNYVPSGTVENGAVVRNNLSCFINTSIANCAVASDATACIECKDVNYSLKSQKCELGNIANCIAYNYNANLSSVTCKACAADYYLDTGKNACVMGKIYNCKALKDNSASTCQTCVDGYVNIASGLDNYDYCYPKDSSIGCNSISIVNDSTYFGGQITCNSCTSGSQVPGSPANTAAKSICMAHSPVTNCKSYNIGSTLAISNFLCKECNAGFYLNSNNRCVARVNQPAKCSAYTVTDDTCTKCDNTSYLSSTSKECVDYPKGILGCRTYSNATTCTACKDGRYLSNNACPKVTTAITNCFYYSSNTTCSTCNTGYALINNACVKATANNCATYTSDTVCASCPSGFVLQTSNSITSCVSLTKTGCAVINVTSPYDCTACTGSYYLESGECKTPTAISNCAAYENKTACSRCNKGYALATDKASCINSVPTVSFVDSQCLDSQVVSTPVCSRCSAGYYFITGACTGTCNTGSDSGCLACDPKKATTCYVCKSGYYQSKDGVCNNNNPDVDSTMIMGILTAIIAIISLIL